MVVGMRAIMDSIRYDSSNDTYSHHLCFMEKDSKEILMRCKLIKEYAELIHNDHKLRTSRDFLSLGNTLFRLVWLIQEGDKEQLKNEIELYKIKIKEE